MIIRKIMAVGLLTAMGYGASAQMYVQGGYNLANITKTEDGQTQDNNWKSTWNAGFMSRFGLSKVFDLESGLLLSGKGAKSNTYFTSSEDDNYVKTSFNPVYLELPLNAVVKLPLAANGKANVFFHAGPYVAMGLFGKSKVETRLLGVTSTSKSDIKFNNDDPTTSGQEGAAYDRLKRFDAGLNFGGGVDFGKLLVKANFGLGLTKINSTQEDNSANDKNKYRTFSLSVGIPLNR